MSLRDVCPRHQLEPDPVVVAPALLGGVVSHGEVSIRITEVEAYRGNDDPGSHAFRGPTPRSQIMFGEAGRAYVYFSYGMHHCLNVVCGRCGTAGAVLLRAGEVVDGEMSARRRRDRGRNTPHPHRDLARGPARMTSALGVDLEQNGIDLCDPESALRLEVGLVMDRVAVSAGPRVGVSGPGGDGSAYPWRFWITGDPTVSAYRPATPRR
ncbi:MAG: DNA-3-methyladenine glycosylase [Ornithinimicrobium sp.]